MNQPVFPISLYCENTPDHVKTLDLSHGDDDFRKVSIVCAGQKKVVIKHCSNSFTDAEKINGWFRLAEAYNRIGIYCPSCVPTLSGSSSYHYTEDNRDYYIYAEEYAPFQTASQIEPKPQNDENGQPIYLADLMRSIGKVASAHLDCVPWASHFCLFEGYGGRERDETTLAAVSCAKLVGDLGPEFITQMVKLFALFFELQAKIKTFYGQLPTSCFQADLNDTNVLVNEDGRFAGVLDFNVCGREPVLNYAIREALMHLENSALCDADGNELYFYSDEVEAIRMRMFLQNMKYIGECYAFSEEEKKAFPLLYCYIASFWWEQVYALKQAHQDKEKAKKYWTGSNCS